MTRQQKWLVFALSLIGLAGVLFVAFIAQVVTSPARSVRRASAELDVTVDAYRSAGMPWVADDLRKGQIDDPAFRAALAKTIGLMDRKAFEERRSEWISAARDGNYARMAANLKPFEGALNNAVKLPEYKSVSLGWDFDQGAAVAYPEFGAMRCLVSGLCLRAETYLSQGRPAEAIQDWKAAAKLRGYANQPGNLPLLVQVAYYRLISQSICRGELNSSKDLPIEVQKLLDLPPVDIRQGFRGEAYAYLATSRNLTLEMLKAIDWGEGPSPIPAESLIRDGLPRDKSVRAVLDKGLDFFHEVDAMIAEASDLAALHAQMTELCEGISIDDGKPWMLLAIMTPIYPDAVLAAATEQIHRNIVQVAIAAIRHRRKNGSYPKTMPSLGAQSLDLFSDEPLLYQVRGDSIHIYSVGPNKKDEGGARDDRGEGNRDDIGLKFP